MSIIEPHDPKSHDPNVPKVPIVPRVTFGWRLRMARMSAHVPIVRLSRELHVSRNAIASWEADEKVPRELAHVVERWAALTDVNKYWLMFGDAPMRCTCGAAEVAA